MSSKSVAIQRVSPARRLVSWATRQSSRFPRSTAMTIAIPNYLDNAIVDERRARTTRVPRFANYSGFLFSCLNENMLSLGNIWAVRSVCAVIMNSSRRRWMRTSAVRLCRRGAGAISSMPRPPARARHRPAIRRGAYMRCPFRARRWNRAPGSARPVPFCAAVRLVHPAAPAAIAWRCGP